jgi:hypothetical protein
MVASQADDAWRSLFSNQRIRWVVRAPDYPESLSIVLKRLESENVLVACATEKWRIGPAIVSAVLVQLQPIMILGFRD